MSLVNDALRRAKEAQRQAPPPPMLNVPYRPQEAIRPARKSLGLLVPAMLVALALLLLLFAWQWVQRHPAPDIQQARALTPATMPVPNAPPTPAPAVDTRLPLQTEPRTAPSTAAEAPVAAAAPKYPATSGTAANPEPAVTNAAVTAPPPAPKPPPLRLQAIVFDPRRPSALINGKSLFIGEKLGDARVVAIDQESATLVSAGKTNVLSLAE